MGTFDRALLFTKDNCIPCELTKEFIRDEIQPELLAGLSKLRKEHHTALVETYEIDLYPTLLIIDSDGVEIDRCVGGKNVRANIHQFLTEIFYARCI